MKIAIAGASGRIGRVLLEEAERRGHSVIAIDRLDGVAPMPDNPDRQVVLAEMADFYALADAFAGCDALINLAAIPSPGRHPDHVVHNNNVVGSFNALQAAALNGITRVCQASSVNAIGHAFSQCPHYDYFPIDEVHPNYSEDPYSLSKWICEQQADAFVRRFPDMTIASLRFHFVCEDRSVAKSRYDPNPDKAKHLWAYSLYDASVDACLRSIEASFTGHEVFNIVARETISDTPSRDLASQYFPTVALKETWGGHDSFFDSSKAERMLGWLHDNVIGPT